MVSYIFSTSSYFHHATLLQSSFCLLHSLFVEMTKTRHFIFGRVVVPSNQCTGASPFGMEVWLSLPVCYHAKFGRSTSKGGLPYRI